MKRYDISAGFKRTEIPQTIVPRIIYHEIRWPYEFAMGTPLVKPYILILGTGDRVITDATLIHEVHGHILNETHITGNWNDQTAFRESQATRITLERMLVLEEKYPGNGYGQYIDRTITKLAEARAGPRRLSPWKRFTQEIQGRFYADFCAQHIIDARIRQKTPSVK